MKANGQSLKRRKAASHEAGKTFCEFFAGIGLKVHLGLERSGWRCVFANDIDPKKQTAYEARFGKSEHFHLGDIWNTEEVIGAHSRPPVADDGLFPLHRPGVWPGTIVAWTAATLPASSASPRFWKP